MSWISPETLGTIIHGIDAWLETMRGSSGYGGPAVHWWQDCLHYTGTGLDWRYEGIIIGYLNLYEKTGQSVWLSKAQQAGDDLVTGQLPEGNFRNSSFENNPKPGGTPHEAACDLALIQLAHVMRNKNIPGWEPYAQTAKRNIQAYILGQLWIPETRYFQNLVYDPIFVPNKAATIAEALSAWVDFSDDDAWLHKYILPTLDRIITCQIHIPNDKLFGAIDQARGIKQREGWYFPFYNARCIPALLIGYQRTNQPRYLESAILAMDFILRVRLDDGSIPQVIRNNGRTYRYPQWVAGIGDVLRAMSCLIEDYPQGDITTTLEWMLQGVLPSGGIRAASGFARRNWWTGKTKLPDFRDLLPVTGWVDKAFRYLTSLVSVETPLVQTAIQTFEQPCQYGGRECTYYEDSQQIQIRNKTKVHYRWVKGADSAEIYRQ